MKGPFSRRPKNCKKCGKFYYPEPIFPDKQYAITYLKVSSGADRQCRKCNEKRWEENTFVWKVKFDYGLGLDQNKCISIITST